MPQDTIWLNSNGDFITGNLDDTETLNLILREEAKNSLTTYSYSPKNTPHSDSLLKEIITVKQREKNQSYIDEKAYYDRLSTKLEFVISVGFILLIIYAIYRKKKRSFNPGIDEDDWVEIGTPSADAYYRSFPSDQPRPVPYFCYNGKDLNFSQEQISRILNFCFPYFKKLSTGEKNRFLNRHLKFMKSKLFYIHDKTGVKEMPVLISAAAVQLSFGLEEYLLPFFRNIHVFPEEFLGVHPAIRFLEGNVSGNDINISWKHFLRGYEIPDNGENVGLHEMAHAFYCQNFKCTDNRDEHFTDTFSSFSRFGEKAFNSETQSTSPFYSDYALRNFQEFWAESIERFFERGAEMKILYPEMYISLSNLLKQTTA